jgi:hypothetical protein
MAWLTGTWSPLCRVIEDIPGKRWFDLCVPDGPGVYRLIALDASKSGIVPASLDRVCGSDPTGTLYIGAAGSLQGRLGDLVKTNDPTKFKGGGHRRLTMKLAECFSPQWRALVWEYADEPFEREGQLLRDYEGQFGERPPVNTQ